MEAVHSATNRDVLSGRGQGVQRHGGNVKYRHLVFVNKALYAQCPRQDKVKISRGIVRAIRELGGRFLELDERTSVYSDIGDKKAIEKTSQALREGQTKLRQQIYEEEKRSGRATTAQRQYSAEGYFGFSVQVLESLYENEKEAGRPMVDGGGVGQQQPQAKVAEPTNPQIAAAMGQFEGMNKATSPAGGAEPLQRDSLNSRLTRMRLSVGGDRPSMDLSCLFSLDSINNLVNNSKTDRKTIESVLTSEIVDLIRMSEPQLEEIERLTATMPGSFAFDAAASDRVSELRMTDVGLPQTQGGSAAEAAAMDLSPAAGASAGIPPRGTDVSLMRQSIMTYGVDDMTTTGDADGTSGGKKRSASELSKSITDTNNGAEILATMKGEGNTMDV
ncbi:hypothetical protein THAOC_11959 [Thalassiosira oceanica]|uniref:DUF6824 domain-containing protein n=1 Tax=Thalassiosira oceanica TaxID=159749 RepID=K0SNW0_THAOC|nr:hypothetical protein THAOC_11959 [Thalassiosira oceanica]|eukprot:EJK67055.1 hypothetical protein THAOC_11959 [Thalassiosira oceanica]